MVDLSGEAGLRELIRPAKDNSHPLAPPSSSREDFLSNRAERVRGASDKNLRKTVIGVATITTVQERYYSHDLGASDT